MNKHPIFNNTQFKKLRDMDRDVLWRRVIRENFDRWNHEEKFDGLGCTSGFKHHQIPMKAFASLVSAKVAGLFAVSVASIMSAPKMTIPAQSAYRDVKRDMDGFCKTHLYECFKVLLDEKEEEKKPAVVIATPVETVPEEEVKQPTKDLKASIAAVLQESADEDWE